jgi:peptidoglycan/xylan/chitin deacetylase (PgdA/CDA1 family)
MLDEIDYRAFQREIAANRDAIHTAVGRVPSLLRPPAGKLSLKNLAWAGLSRVRIVHFTYSPKDWQATSALDVWREIPFHKLRGGEIICLHDDNPHTVEALPRIVESISQLGLSCKALPVW